VIAVGATVTSTVTTLLLTIACGVAIPWLVAFVTKESISPALKAMVLTFLSLAAGVLAGLVGTPPTGWDQWQAVILNFFIAFVGAVASEHGLWHPTGTTPTINHATARFGIGPTTAPHRAPQHALPED
jgi:hypothetical protein